MTKDELKNIVSSVMSETLKKYNINEIETNNMLFSLNEYMDNHMFEGIDVDDENHIVSFNPNHQEYVDTNDHWNPKPIYNEINGYKVISIFKRKDTENNLDGNPLIYALKGHKWKFKNPSYDIFALLRRFVAVTKELKETYDVIITTPSSNKLNTEVLYKVRRLIKHETSYEDFFMKNDAIYVYEELLDNNWIEKHYNEKDAKRIDTEIYRAICRIQKSKDNGGNDGVFSYKFIRNKDVRNAIIQSMSINDMYKDEITYGKYLNGKKILVIDDTVTSGKTISDSAEAIIETYAPESITFLTLFSPLMSE